MVLLPWEDGCERHPSIYLSQHHGYCRDAPPHISSPSVLLATLGVWASLHGICWQLVFRILPSGAPGTLCQQASLGLTGRDRALVEESGRAVRRVVRSADSCVASPRPACPERLLLQVALSLAREGAVKSSVPREESSVLRAGSWRGAHLPTRIGCMFLIVW